MVLKSRTTSMPMVQKAQVDEVEQKEASRLEENLRINFLATRSGQPPSPATQNTPKGRIFEP